MNVVVRAPGAALPRVISAIRRTLRGIPAPEEIEGARERAILQELRGEEDAWTQFHARMVECLHRGGWLHSEDRVANLRAVEPADVVGALSELAQCKPAVVVVGDAHAGEIREAAES